MEDNKKRFTMRFNLDNEVDRAIYTALEKSPYDMTRTAKDVLYKALILHEVPNVPTITSTPQEAIQRATEPQGGNEEEITVEIEEEELGEIDL